MFISFKPSIGFPDIICRRYVCPICGKEFRSRFPAIACSREHSCKHSTTGFSYYISEESGDLTIYEFCENCYKTMRDGTFIYNDEKLKQVLDILEKK